MEILYFLAVIIGLCVGSFNNVLIYRLPLGKNISYPPSKCPCCKNRLKIWHNIPLFSWLFLRGKCNFCAHKISVRYPLIELLTMIVFILPFLVLGVGIETWVYGFLFAFLLALAVIDCDHHAVPDSLNLFCLALVFLTPVLSLNFALFESMFCDALLFMGSYAILRFILSFFLQKESSGEGDLPLFGIIGAILGVQMGLFAVYLSAVLAILVFWISHLREKKIVQLPYIPFLFSGLLLCVIFSKTFYQLLNELF